MSRAHDDRKENPKSLVVVCLLTEPLCRFKTLPTLLNHLRDLYCSVHCSVHFMSVWTLEAQRRVVARALLISGPCTTFRSRDDGNPGQIRASHMILSIELRMELFDIRIQFPGS